MANAKESEQLTVAENFRQIVDLFDKLAPSKQRDLQKILEEIRFEKARLAAKPEIRASA
ncbi:MAG: hypothetical protein ACR2RE_28580 [Geminicoccaceae bacterium]